MSPSPGTSAPDPPDSDPPAADSPDTDPPASDSPAADSRAVGIRPRTSRVLPLAAFDVPEGEEPAARCPHCDRPFRSERTRDLHVGEVHLSDASEAEIDRYEAAYDDEDDDLFVFHLKFVAAIVAGIMGYVYLYGFVLS